MLNILLRGLVLTNQSQAHQTYRGDSRENSSAACTMFRCGHGLFNQQRTTNTKMLGYILMVTACAGKERKFRSRQLSKETEHQDCSSERCTKCRGSCLLNTTWSTHHQNGHNLGLFLKGLFAVLHLCGSWIHCSGEEQDSLYSYTVL